MAALIQWIASPFNSVERVMLGAMRRPCSFDELDMPSVDISEDKENFYIISELPGMKEGDVKVTVDPNLLTISGKKLGSRDQNERKYHHNERAFGEFVRSFSMPRSVKVEAISGTFRDGLLELTLPKRAMIRPLERDIPLNTASANRGAKTNSVSATPNGQNKPEAKAALA